MLLKDSKIIVYLIVFVVKLKHYVSLDTFLWIILEDIELALHQEEF